MENFKNYLGEDLRKWFGKGKEGDWVRVDTKGEIKGDCAREPGEGKPKCMPRSKAHSMDKDDRAKAARRKRRQDPVADRKGKGGKPIMVATEEIIVEKNVPTNPKLWSKYKAQAKAKFDVYPSAYANGWASKMYKKAGGSWKTVSESLYKSPAHERLQKQMDKIRQTAKYKDSVRKLGGTPEKPGSQNMFVPTRKEGKEHTWKSEGHYTKDGTEWTGPQHAHNGQVMTGKKHTADSQNLYHYKELSKAAQDKVEKMHEIDEDCWDGYKQKGMKKKGKKIVPNCVPESFRTRNKLGENSTNKSSEHWSIKNW